MNTNKNTLKIWGINKFGQEVKEHDKLECGSCFDKWFTHVMFDAENNRWHREADYFSSKVIGEYTNQ